MMKLKTKNRKLIYLEKAVTAIPIPISKKKLSQLLLLLYAATLMKTTWRTELSEKRKLNVSQS